MKTTLSTDPLIYVIFIDLIVRDSNHIDIDIFLSIISILTSLLINL